MFFNAFVNGETDEQWLTRLKDGKVEAVQLQTIICAKQQQKKDKNKPLSELPLAASLLAWLIVSHHRLPAIESYRETGAPDFQKLFKVITQKWGYENNYDEAEFNENLGSM